MRGRSWMAALALAAGIVPALHSSILAEERTTPGKVKLDLEIRGLDRRGCDVEIKPAFQNCRFRTQFEHVGYYGKLSLTLDDVQTTSADRECAIAITIREPGQGVRTFRRGVRLAAAGSSSVPVLKCFLSSPSKLAQAEKMTERR